MNISVAVKTGIKLILPIALIVVMMLWLTGTFKKGRISPVKLETKTISAVGIPAYPVGFTQMPVISEAVGTIQPEYRMTISSRISAEIVEMRARAGQQLQKNDLLVRLDSRDLISRVAQAKETLHRAQAVRSLAASDYGRDKPLMEKAVIPRSEFDQTDMRLRAAEADVQHAKEALRDAEVSLSYADIRCPASGVVIDKLADVGDLATPGKTLLTMYEKNRLWLEANVREQEASLLQIGAEYTVRIGASGDKMNGKLVEIIPSADPSSRSLTARVRLPRTEGLYPGMFGHLFIPVRKTESLLIPESAIIRIGQLCMVDVIDADLIKRRSIQTGERIGDLVEVLSGLVEGERIVLSPVHGGTP